MERLVWAGLSLLSILCRSQEEVLDFQPPVVVNLRPRVVSSNLLKPVCPWADDLFPMTPSAPHLLVWINISQSLSPGHTSSADKGWWRDD